MHSNSRLSKATVPLDVTRRGLEQGPAGGNDAAQLNAAADAVPFAALLGVSFF